MHSSSFHVPYLSNAIQFSGNIFINDVGLIVNAFHNTLGRQGYFPSEAGTSEGQLIMIRASVLAYKSTGNLYWLKLAKKLSSALEILYMRTPPLTPTELYIPHWLFTVKGATESQSANLAYPITMVYNGTDRFIGTVPAGGTDYGDRVLKLTRLYGNDGGTRLDFANPFAGVIGTDYGVPENVVTDETGTTFEIPEANVGSNVDFTANLIAIYDFGDAIPKSTNLEAWPYWRLLDDTEISCAVDTLPWAYEAFNLMFEVTRNPTYALAANATKYNIYDVYDVDDGRPWFRRTPDHPLEVSGTYYFSSRAGFDETSFSRDLDLAVAITVPAGTGEAQYGRGVTDEFKAQDTGVLLDWVIEDLTDTTIRVFLQKGTSELTATRYFYDVNTSNTPNSYNGEMIINKEDFVPYQLTELGWVEVNDPIVDLAPIDVVGFVVETPAAVNFQVRRFRPIPKIDLPYVPHVAPFTANTLRGYVIDWRGASGVGYQDPVIWAKLDNTAGLDGMLQYLEDSQAEYNSRYSLDGLFVPSYVWDRYDRGSVTGATPDTWTFDWVDPNTEWVGYNARVIASCAEAGDIVAVSDPTNAARAFEIARKFMAILHSEWTNTDHYPPTNFPETITFLGRNQAVEVDTVCTVYNGYVYRCTVAGTTAGTQPSYPTVNMHIDTVTDGTAEFMLIGYSYSTAPMYGSYEEPHAVALFMRAACYLYKNNIAKADMLEYVQRGWTYLERIWAESLPYDGMNGTWSNYPQAGEYFGFWSGEIVTLLAKLLDELDSVRADAGIPVDTIKARLDTHAIWIVTNTEGGV